jgi:tRNA (guanine-N7-)-methyltransferase
LHYLPEVLSTPKPSLIHEFETILEPMNLAVAFPTAQSLEVELGSGDGSFLLEYARLHPDRNFIGVERLLGRLKKLDRKGRRAGLVNLIGLRIESAYFLKHLLPSHSAEAVHVYFPDPWPKRKHRRYRLINEEFPALAQQALAAGGRVYLRTDDRDYFQQMESVFASATSFQRVETPPGLAAVLTDFEKDFHARGIPTLIASYALEPARY